MTIVLLLFLVVAGVAPASSSARSGFSLELTFDHSATGLRPYAIRPNVTAPNSNPLVTISFGTPTPRPQVLLLDTGSDLTWFRCEPSSGTFEPSWPPFDPTHSQTSRLVLFGEQECRVPGTENSHGTCVIVRRYAGGTVTHANLTWETITAPSSGGGEPQRVPHILFGCSFKTDAEKKGVDRGMSGVLGMNRGGLALHRQLEHITNFSHCFPSSTSARTYLRFGTDTNVHGPITLGQFIPFADNRFHGASPGAYYLHVVDFSVNNQKVGLPPGTPQLNAVIDSGTTLSTIQSDAYELLKAKLVQYFQSKGFQPVEGRDVPQGFDLCYKATSRPIPMPSVGIHFQDNKVYLIRKENLFAYLQEKGVLCFGMVRSHRTLLGSFQQRNMRIIYDLVPKPTQPAGRLLFGWEDCSRDPAA